MEVDLDKKALISLVMGTSPNYGLFENPKVKPFGRFHGGVDTWHWGAELKELSKKELYELYLMCRESWE